MSQAPIAGQVVPPNPWHMVRSMVGVGLLCGLIIVSVFQATEGVIERNKAEALQRAIFRVLPEARASATFRYGGEERFARIEGGAEAGTRVYAGYDADKRLVGIALTAEGMGYQDVIRLIYGYAFAQDAIVGIRVLESRETPGLGDKIETDDAFLENFARLDVSVTEDRSALAHLIEFVKKGKKERSWQVDGITGATISSNAVADILSRSASTWIPRIQRNLSDFREAE
jgi:electron transport complex protein RnfG